MVWVHSTEDVTFRGAPPGPHNRQRRCRDARCEMREGSSLFVALRRSRNSRNSRNSQGSTSSSTLHWFWKAHSLRRREGQTKRRPRHSPIDRAGQFSACICFSLIRLRVANRGSEKKMYYLWLHDAPRSTPASCVQIFFFTY